jgi:hypothetical protein
MGYAERALNRRAELLWRVRHGVISVVDIEAAKRASSSFCDVVDVGVVGHTAPEHATKGNGRLANFPTVNCCSDSVRVVVSCVAPITTSC